MAIQYTITVPRIAGLSASAGRTGPVAVEGTVRPAPHSALPIFGDCLVLGLPWRKPESGGSRPISRLSRDAWPYVVWAVVRDEQRRDVQLSSVKLTRCLLGHVMSSTGERKFAAEKNCCA